jgi:hypothetical protein
MKKEGRWTGILSADRRGSRLTVFPECFAVALSEKSTGRELSSSKWLSLAKISDLVE